MEYPGNVLDFYKSDVMAIDLDQVNWGILYAGEGEPEQIPNAIRLLYSNEIDDCTVPIETLYNCLCSRGEFITEAAGYAVPFLISALGQVPPKCLSSLLALLADIVSPQSYSSSVYDSQRARAEIYKGLEVYLSLLDHPDMNVRIGCIRVLQSFPQNIGQIHSALEQKLNSEPNENVRKTLKAALRHVQ